MLPPSPPPPAEKLQNFFGVFLQFQIGVDTMTIPVSSGTYLTENYVPNRWGTFAILPAETPHLLCLPSDLHGGGSVDKLYLPFRL